MTTQPDEHSIDEQVEKEPEEAPNEEKASEESEEASNDEKASEEPEETPSEEEIELMPAARSMSRRSPARQISVFRDRLASFRTMREFTAADQEHLFTQLDEDDIPIRSPLSSVPFLMWGLFGMFLAVVLTLFWTQLAGPVFEAGRGGQWRESLLTFLNANSRSLGVLFASVVTLCAIAIPLTANNYTSKLIHLFTNSKVNRLMFLLLVLANVLNLSCLMLFDLNGHLPLIEVSVAAFLSLLCYVLVVPYALYVFHFLQPDEIIHHIEKEVMDDLLAVREAGNGPLVEVKRKQIIQNLKNLSNIALRSVERYDRDTAMLALEGLRHIIHHYFAFKDQMPSQWFRVSRMYFLSLSGEMRRRVERGRTFLEAEVMEEFAMVLSVTFGRLRDMVRMISRTARHIGVEANEKQMASVLELMSLYFNTFLRAAISRREPEAVYMIVYHYRRMAEEMLPTNANRPVRVAYYLSYYGNQAVRSGMVYVANLISFDLGHMVALAYEQDAPSKRELLDTFVRFEQDGRMTSLLGVMKSRIKLAVLMHHLGYEEEQEEICRSLAPCDVCDLKIAIGEMSEVTSPMYWEVTDRHRHNDYLPPASIRSFAFVKKRLLEPEETGKAA